LILSAGYTESNGCDSPLCHRVRHDAEAFVQEADHDGSVQAGPRYASVYQIHKTRCIFCGYCEEACPVGAIFMGKDYELAVYSKDDFVWDKTELLVPASSTPTGA
jgi:formate hydrogenlyase subunit 6/NADH:ubiquinone oxidoreductase subunit I